MSNTKTTRALAFLVAVVLCLSVCCTAFAKYRTIPYGEISDDVRTMQKSLKKKGFYRGTVDGEFGKGTRSAVYRYQKSIGLKADGKPGDRTLTALYHGTSAINNFDNKTAAAVRPKNPKTLFYGCTGSRVRQLQRALKALGYFKGSIDGKYGNMTELAVRKYQTARGMHVDGMAGTKTISSINSAQSKVHVGTTFLLAVGSRGTEVSHVQAGLRKAGYKLTDSDGYFGTSTRDALKKYQKAHNMSETGTLTQSQYNDFIK